jgi:hypothetical protein
MIETESRMHTVGQATQEVVGSAKSPTPEAIQLIWELPKGAHSKCSGGENPRHTNYNISVSTALYAVHGLGGGGICVWIIGMKGGKEACNLRAFVAYTIDTPTTVDGRRRRRKKLTHAQDSMERVTREEQDRKMWCFVYGNPRFATTART